jgi:hypothetical protein
VNAKDIEVSLNTIEREINEGHYLDRMIALTREFDLTQHLNVLLAFREILLRSHKPQGLDQFLCETSTAILGVFIRAKFPKRNMQQVVYCLEYDSLNEYLGAKLFNDLRTKALTSNKNTRSNV